MAAPPAESPAIARFCRPGATRYFCVDVGDELLDHVVLERRVAGAPPPAAAAAGAGAFLPLKGITTIIGTAFFSAIRLSRIRFAAPAVVHPSAVSPAPCTRYSTGYRARAGEVARRQVDQELVRVVVRGRVMDVPVDAAVGNVAHLPGRGRRARHFDEARGGAHAQLDLRVDRVGDGHAVDREEIKMHGRLERRRGDAPDAAGILGHRHHPAGRGCRRRQPVAGQRDGRGLRGSNAEGDGLVRMHFRRHEGVLRAAAATAARGRSRRRGRHLLRHDHSGTEHRHETGGEDESCIHRESPPTLYAFSPQSPPAQLAVSGPTGPVADEACAKAGVEGTARGGNLGFHR